MGQDSKEWDGGKDWMESVELNYTSFPDNSFQSLTEFSI